MSTSKPRLLTPILIWFMLAMVLANVASQMVYTVLPLYIRNLGASVGQVGLVYSLAALLPLALQVLGGWLSDTIGRLRIIAIGSAIATLGYLGFVLSHTWQWVLVSLTLEFISSAAVGPSFGAFIADQSSEANRGRIYGLTTGIFLVVGVVGPPLGGWLVDRRGYRLMMAIAFALYTSATLLRIWMARTSHFGVQNPPARPTMANLGADLRLISGLLFGGGILTWIFITDGVSDISFLLSREMQPLYLSQVGGLSVTQIGLLHSVVATTMMLVAAPAGWLSDRLGERVIITAGFLLPFAGWLLFVRMTGFWTFALVSAILGMGYGLLNPAYQSLVSKVVPEGKRGLAFGFTQTSLGLISLPAPWIGAQLWEGFGPATPFRVTAFAALAAAGLAWSKFRLRIESGAAMASCVTSDQGDGTRTSADGSG